MVRQIHGWFPAALHDAALEVRYHHIAWPHLVVIHAAGLDHHQPLRAIDPAGIAAVHGHEAGAENAEVRLPDFAAEPVESGGGAAHGLPLERAVHLRHVASSASIRINTPPTTDRA